MISSYPHHFKGHFFLSQPCLLKIEALAPPSPYIQSNNREFESYSIFFIFYLLKSSIQLIYFAHDHNCLRISLFTRVSTHIHGCDDSSCSVNLRLGSILRQPSMRLRISGLRTVLGLRMVLSDQSGRPNRICSSVSKGMSPQTMACRTTPRDQTVNPSAV